MGTPWSSISDSGTLLRKNLAMVNDSIQRGALPQDMNKGLIELLHKGGNREELANWRPVTLLNVPNKILAKALQRRIQPLMAEIIHEDQTGFIPMRYILDNVLLQHELIEWSRESRQDMLLLKLDFRKAYDTVSLPFFFQAMRKLGIPEEYIKMTKILFQDAQVPICLNGRVSNGFFIGRGVR
jgi:hypothetical protein